VDLTDDRVRRLRAAAQRLHRPGRGSTSDLVAHLLGVQAQDIAAAPLALRARAEGLTASAVTAAREDRSIVRTWGPRGTLHLMAAEDVGWLVRLTGPTWRPASTRRLVQEGVGGTPAELVRTVEHTLAGAGPLTKVELGQRLPATVTAKRQGLVHLLALAAADGKVVLGPDRGHKPTYVHAADWLDAAPKPVDRDRDRDLAELARRYLRGHAPAGPDDLAAWSGLPLRDARAGWQAIADELIEERHRGQPVWRHRHGAARPVEVAVSLLPAFDEWLLGWRDRSLVLDPAHRASVLHGGIIAPVVLVDGQVAGGWRGDTVSLYRDLTEAQRGALAAEQQDVARFRGR
jgi:hypothetical protein